MRVEIQVIYLFILQLLVEGCFRRIGGSINFRVFLIVLSISLFGFGSQRKFLSKELQVFVIGGDGFRGMGWLCLVFILKVQIILERILSLFLIKDK